MPTTPLWTEARAIGRRERSRRTTRDGGAVGAGAGAHHGPRRQPRRRRARASRRAPPTPFPPGRERCLGRSPSLQQQVGNRAAGGAQGWRRAVPLLPCTSMWWLDHYDELARHLEVSHARRAERSRSRRAFELRAPPPSSNGKAGKAAAPDRDGDGPLPEVLGDVLRCEVPGTASARVGRTRGGQPQQPRALGVLPVPARGHGRGPSPRDQGHRGKARGARAGSDPFRIRHARPRQDGPGEAIGCKVVVSFRGYDINSFGVEDRRYYEDVWQSADMLHVVGENIWERARRRGCPSDRPHTVITDAVDTSLFRSPDRTYESVGTAGAPVPDPQRGPDALEEGPRVWPRGRAPSARPGHPGALPDHRRGRPPGADAVQHRRPRARGSRRAGRRADCAAEVRKCLAGPTPSCIPR